jgi:hypothetical protein
MVGPEGLEEKKRKSEMCQEMKGCGRRSKKANRRGAMDCRESLATRVFVFTNPRPPLLIWSEDPIPFLSSYK